jgi:hypothetical protein
MLLTFQKPAVRGNYATGNQAFSNAFEIFDHTHAKPHVTKERYIKAFDPAVLAAMKSLETTLDTLDQCSANVQQVN